MCIELKFTALVVLRFWSKILIVAPLPLELQNVPFDKQTSVSLGGL